MASIWDWSKTASSNTTADADINWQEGQNANTVNNSARAMMGRTAELLDDLGGLVTVSGTNTLTCTTNSAFTALANGLLFAFTAANDNTGAVTLAPNSLTAKKLIKFTSTGETELAAGDLKAGGKYLVVYSSAADSATGAWVLLNIAPPDISTYMRGLLDDADEATFKASVNLEIGTDVQAYRAELALVNLSGSNIASASSIDLSAATGDFVGITGTTTISAMGTVAAGAERVLVFAGSLTLTHNGTSLILPGGANITTAAGDVAIMRSLGSGNWRCINYSRASGLPIATIPVANGGTGATTAVGGLDALSAKGSDLASSSTVDIGAATGDLVDITGTTTITSLGTAAAGVRRTLQFDGALTLTHSSAIILPGGANITTAAGDVAIFRSLGSGNWLCVSYSRASGAPLSSAVSITSGTIGGVEIQDDVTFADPSATQSALGLGTASVVDYTAGTWSPTAAFATPGTSSMSYAVQTGNYVRIGNVVTFDLIINFTPTIGTASGDLRISLPTAAAGQTALCVASSTNTLTWPGSATSLTAMTASGQSYFTVRVLKSAANAATIGTTDMTGGSAHGFIVSGAYIAS